MTTRHEALRQAMEMRKADGFRYVDETRPFKLLADGPVGDCLQEFIEEASAVLAACEARLH